MTNTKLIAYSTACVSNRTLVNDFALNKRDRIVEVHAADHDKVVIKGSSGFILLIGTSWYYMDTDVNVSTATDLDTGSVSNGKDYYVYACDNSGTLVFRISLASTYPAGYSAATSRKLGGFHTLCATVGTIASHTLSGYVANDILPASIWDLKHRAVCEPEGMVYAQSINKWVDIYLASGTGASTASVNGASIEDNRNWMDFVDDGVAVYKRLLSDVEFQAIAAGTREEAQIWTRSDPVTTGGHTAYFLLTVTGTPSPDDWAAGDTLTGGSSAYTATIVEVITSTTYLCKNISNSIGFTAAETLTASGTGSGTATYSTWAADSRGRIISNIGCEDGCGALYQWLQTPSARLDDGTVGGWYDLPGDKGSFYTYGTNSYVNTQLLAGGAWDNGAHCGTRGRRAHYSRWPTSTSLGARFLADAQ